MDQNIEKSGIPSGIIDDINRDVLRTQKMLSEAFKSYPFQDIARASERINEFAKNVTINLQPTLKRFAESQEFYKKIVESIPKIEIPKLPIMDSIHYHELAPLPRINKTDLKTTEPEEKKYTETELLAIAKGLISLLAEREIKNKKLDITHQFPFQLPETTRWESITIKFINGHDVQVTAGGFTHSTNYSGMGFEDSRKLLPNKQWLLLRVLSISFEKRRQDVNDYDPSLKKTKQLLADSLKKYFGLDSDPFYPYKQEKIYRTKINLIPESESTNNTPEKSLIDPDDELGIWDDYKEKTKGTFDPEELR